jgi:tRNA threonylcarbamoyladenosine biosynthesis protein TsaE
MKKIVTSSEMETFNLGRELGRTCRGGEVFALSGDLGTGKTKFLQGLAAGLGVKERVNSPTFNILKIYHTSGASQKVKIFCHVDAYRLKSATDLTALGLEEYLDLPDTVTAIEWAEIVQGICQPTAKIIKIKQLSEQEREIIFS